MLAFPLTQVTGSVRLPSRHIYVCMLCPQINKCQRTSSLAHTHRHATDTVHPNTNMPHRQNVLESLCVKGTDLCVTLYRRGLSASEHPETLG